VEAQHDAEVDLGLQAQILRGLRRVERGQRSVEPLGVQLFVSLEEDGESAGLHGGHGDIVARVHHHGLDEPTDEDDMEHVAHHLPRGHDEAGGVARRKRAAQVLEAVARGALGLSDITALEVDVGHLEVVAGLLELVADAARSPQDQDDVARRRQQHPLEVKHDRRKIAGPLAVGGEVGVGHENSTGRSEGHARVRVGDAIPRRTEGDEHHEEDAKEQPRALLREKAVSLAVAIGARRSLLL